MSPRSRWVPVLLALLIGCGADGAASGSESAHAHAAAGNSPIGNADESQGEPAEPSEVPDMTQPLHLRLELDRTTIPAGVSTSNHAEARVEGRLIVRNASDQTQRLEFVRPAAFELSWTFVRADGTVFLPTFLPPPPPPPGGRPRTTLTLAAGEETSIADVHGISGFLKQGDAPENWGPLPAGIYQVRVGGVRVQESRSLDAPPVTLRAE